VLSGERLGWLKSLLRRAEFRCAAADAISALVSKGVPTVDAKLALLARIELKVLLHDALREFMLPDASSLRRARDESELT
jgi:hypothetical protein